MNEDIGVLVFIFGMIIGILIFAIFGTIGDDGDIINTRILGERMCQEHNLEYNYREIKNHMTPNEELIIYCRNIGREIEDGYLRLK